MKQRINWTSAIFISVISGTVSFLVFLLSQIMWGDVLKDMLKEGFKNQLYTNINIILLSGLLIILGISFVLNIFIFQEYTKLSKFLANLFSFIIALIFVFFIAWINIVIVLSDFYLNLSWIQRIYAIPFYLAYYSIYVLRSPVHLWYIALIIYHISLIFMIKIFFIRKSFKYTPIKEKKKNQPKELYKSRL